MCMCLLLDDLLPYLHLICIEKVSGRHALCVPDVRHRASISVCLEEGWGGGREGGIEGESKGGSKRGKREKSVS